MVKPLDGRTLWILHIEDDAFDAQFIERELRTLSYPCRIVRVVTFEEFKAAIENQSFDLILSDAGMPAFDALETLSFARQVLPGIPIIFVSGNENPRISQELVEQGASVFLSKRDLSHVPVVIRQIFELE